MSENLRNYTKAVYAMDAVVQRTPDAAWTKQSPCESWTAREVLGHFMWGAQRVTSVATGAELPAEKAEADVAGADPKASWAATRDALFAALDHPGALAQAFDGPFGPGTLDDFLGIHTLDCMLHTWDVAKTAGIHAHLPPDIAAAGAAGLAAAGDALRGPGLFGPAVETTSDNPVTQFVAISGRDPN
jgi:uncharacterized protein (TIGR03086 family)